MDRAATNLEIRIERTIQAAPEKAYDAWLDPGVPGTPWNAASKLILDSKLDGLFYTRMKDTPHYGRFTVLERGREIRHTWMSPYTEGQESVVTVTFTRAGNDTQMVLVHTGLPDNDNGQAHRKGWTFFMDSFPRHFAGGA
jgi:uncharacterized protein YndB with AHSA1/START domain